MTSREKLEKLKSYICNILIFLLGIRLLVFPIFEIPNSLIFNSALFILLLIVGGLDQYELCCAYKTAKKNTKGKLLIALISLIIWLFVLLVFYMDIYRLL